MTVLFNIWSTFFNIAFSQTSDFLEWKRLKNNLVKVSKKLNISSPKFNKINFGECEDFQGG
jgi:hypothetical protein